MTATADYMDRQGTVTEPVASTSGGRLILRFLQRIVGFALTLAALALWLAPGTSWESDVMLFKLILSITSVAAGLGLMHASAQPLAPEVEIDLIRREIRVVRRDRGAGASILEQCSFADLGKVERDGPFIRLWDARHNLIAEVTLTDAQVQRNLLAGLRDAGKLC